MTHIGIIIGSTRPGRLGAAVGDWTLRTAVGFGHPRVTYELVDLAEFHLPVLDEPVPAMMGDYRHEHTRRWAERIGSLDGFIVVTPEYNHSTPGGLKNAIDYLFAEWNDKAAGFVSYGVHGGVRAVENLRLTLAEVKTATVRSQVALSVYTDVDYTGLDTSDPTVTGILAPAERHARDLQELIDDLVAWSRALATVRQHSRAVAA